MDTVDYDRLALLYRRASSLAPLPEIVMRLIRQIDDGNASAEQLERTINADPVLSANLLRLGSLGTIGGRRQFGTSVRSTIIMLGHRTVRNVSLSMLTQGAFRANSADCVFDQRLTARHSLLVGLLAKTLGSLAGRAMFDSDDSDVFAAGLLHELPLALLAKVAPSAYNELSAAAMAANRSLEAMFEIQYGHPIGELGALAIDAWRLPEVFAQYQGSLSDPWRIPAITRGLCALRYANFLSTSTPWHMEDWEVNEGFPNEIIEELDLAGHDVTPHVREATEQVETYFKASDRRAA